MTHRTPAPGRRLVPWLLAAMLAGLTACGGGGGSDAGGQGMPNAGGPGSGGNPATPPPATATGTVYAAGPITGFGSIIVNGVRFDDSDAAVTDDEGRDGRGRLQLGMVVEIDGQQFDRARGVGRALQIRFGSEIVGPVAAVDTTAGSLIVLGQTVVVTDTTVFDDRLDDDLAALLGSVIEVHAQFDAASGHYTARRIEPAAGALVYKLRGAVANLDPVAKTFTIGGELISYAALAAADLPANLADGLVVRVRLLPAQVDGRWIAASVRHGVRKVDDRADADLRGAITVWRSATDFEIDGLLVDATTAAFPDGREGVVLGAMVEVEGRIVDGVLIATKVELDARHAKDRHRNELHGTIGAIDRSQRTFKLRGVTVSYAGSVVYEDGSEADLANGRKVVVKGLPGSDRRTLVASTIDFES